MGGGGNLKILVNCGGANRLKWAQKIENSVIDPPTIREGESVYLILLQWYTVALVQRWYTGT